MLKTHPGAPAGDKTAMQGQGGWQAQVASRVPNTPTSSPFHRTSQHFFLNKQAIATLSLHRTDQQNSHPLTLEALEEPHPQEGQPITPRGWTKSKH